MCISNAALLNQVFHGLPFPAHRWQLVAQAELFGVDADTHEQLTKMPVARYRDCAHVAATLAGRDGGDGTRAGTDGAPAVPVQCMPRAHVPAHPRTPVADRVSPRARRVPGARRSGTLSPPERPTTTEEGRRMKAAAYNR